MGEKGKNVEHIAVLGGTGTGKTYFIKNELIKPAREKGIPVIILDLERDYNGLGAFRVKNWKKNLIPYLKKKGIVRIFTEDYDDYDKDNNETSAIYEYIFKNIEYDKIGSSVLIVVDEVHNQGGHESKSVDKWLKKLLTRGRKRGQKMVIASQRVAEVRKTLVDNCGTWVFKKCGLTDWQAYKKYLPKEELEKLKNSQNKYATIIIRNYGATVWKRIL
jgi:DNA helicase HerA-like ATPase